MKGKEGSNGRDGRMGPSCMKENSVRWPEWPLERETQRNNSALRRNSLKHPSDIGPVGRMSPTKSRRRRTNSGWPFVVLHGHPPDL